MKNPFLNTFFFGYMQLRWRRLLRVLSAVMAVAISFVVEGAYDDEDAIYSFVCCLIISALISYTAKPFFDKEL